MSSQAKQADATGEQLQKWQLGNADALAELRHTCHQALAKILLSRGATPTETDDLLADLWTDCVPGPEDRPSLLEKFSGNCTVLGWLATVATNRWVDLKRRQARQAELASNGS